LRDTAIIPTRSFNSALVIDNVRAGPRCRNLFVTAWMPVVHTRHPLHFWWRVSSFEQFCFEALSWMCNVRGMESRYDHVSRIKERGSKTDKRQIFLPFLLSIFELATKHNRSNLQSQTKSMSNRLHSLRYIFLVAVWVLSASGIVTLSAQSSTYICPLTDTRASIIHMFQCLELFLDVGIIIAVSKISRHAQGSCERWRLLSRLALASAGVLGVLSCLFLLKNPEHIRWSLRLDTKIIIDLFVTSLFCTNFIGSVVYLMNELRLTTIITTVSCVSVYIYHLSALHHRITYSSTGSHGVFVAISLIAFASVVGVAQIERDESKSQQYQSLKLVSSRTLMGLCIFMFVTTTIFGTKRVLDSSQDKWAVHPIDVLIPNARTTSDQWLEQAATSSSLKEAVVEYQSRYKIPPPPHFDKWYDFAISRGSLIVDDFGQIHNDLLPFWGIEPIKIRQMTEHMLDRSWTEVVGLRVSNGTVHIGPHVVQTHRWMLEGVAEMINTFAEWLPDMDLAFNINDECRVAIPWAEMEDLKHGADLARGQLNKNRNLRSFSANTLHLWQGSFMEVEPRYPADMPSEHFYEASTASSFEHYGVIACSPDSPARKYTWWNKKSFCPDCASPHSLGPFLADWKLSGSLCHQPDIAKLHGFHLSPSAFKPTKSPFPIFSQSKISTFSDIIFPSPWNYKNKAVYDASRDMPFSEKENTLFWRGTTSEGFSLGGIWQGMQRQRFVHLVNTPPDTTAVNLLLPNMGSGMGYMQQSIPLSNISSMTNISVAFVGNATRCYGYDCDLQNKELRFSFPRDFQEHWRFKYLFDLDGAGFSGRFLPFLESRSLVFRVAAFRQWFDERLSAWVHFVPVDGRLHDVWDLLAYFGGTRTHFENAHASEAERIAGDGRERAAQVLRKEDMEVYMFRLLLEWGRIVDDQRNEMGFFHL
jgi:hypothetical protein